MDVATPATVAVVGTGAVGSYYGARLCEAGYDVRFLIRSGTEAVRSGGIRVRSHLGDLHLPEVTVAASFEELVELGPVDWLLLALRAYELDQLPGLASAPLLGAGTRILCLTGGIGIEDDVAASLRRYGIFGGLGYIGVGLPEPGNVVHREFGALQIGHHGDDRQAVADAVDLWAPTVVRADAVDCLVRARWLKMLWDVPFNGLSVVAGGADCDYLLDTPALADFARRVMAEVAAIANADLAARGLAVIDAEATMDRAMRLMATTEGYIPSAGVDFVRRRPLEVDAMFARPVQRARELGVAAPDTALLAALVQRLNPASGF